MLGSAFVWEHCRVPSPAVLQLLSAEQLQAGSTEELEGEQLCRGSCSRSQWMHIPAQCPTDQGA